MINKIKKLYICYPGGNINAIVEDPVPKRDYDLVAQKIINIYNKNKSSDKQIEQVAFIEKPKNKKALSRLSLVGEEFSGNAVLCLGALKLKSNKEDLFEISGTNELLRIFVDEKDFINGQMPKLRLIGQLNKTKEQYPIIPLQGITQILILNNFQKNNNWQKNEALRIIKNNGLEKELAVAIVFIKKERKFMKIKPYVYFKKGLKYEIVEETACGSATTAVGIYQLIIKNRSINKLKVIQPSGNSLYISVKNVNNQIQPYLIGKVKIIYQESFNLV
ncbi:hypothetical protein COW98_05075 [Candidatus Roizmanbacteria bacterium CG22_combo_CG10-13_8_21_14_all_35_9]|uniref:Diaminopimelate epimerase n=4 Tax=Candidatus Roizmaniibacteriota TaxID=1752723 RepID=A0A2M8F208_9BACT|nr:MAG: hypothetical protein COX47_03140 [Candidatus Roizmanbacteria bacterium CG23_combo_of_CG06-09_8_20_14_all_35_49]PIP62256.1 MAG: hypothetical protein COW98_05075 [Candidatus Roizmanbacteria bacterium CG22_combo_CG10-13_8_21_14_all_35_9]PIY71036.1 MAG: hypothetical protein COY88_02445 [Candidatus Roizmanbacteria bacterium CG_4_10_14_0_8_um_filter_35_28]PJC33322.1 MAG: hypothetical protein CO048_03365 [Candidatus Roizmanbacteria bacterium CG_4_9_14_0_2_um_filter_35_15]PJC82945.1 MAG: hypoth